jgi:hypothetical protein
MAVYIDDLMLLILLEAIVFLYGLLFIGWLLAAVAVRAAVCLAVVAEAYHLLRRAALM